MIRAYHFVGDTLRDGRPIPADGEWLVHGGEVVMCESGLHASRDPFDALQYAPGPVLCLVECEGIVSEDKDKLVCRRRKIIARFDATDTLRAFARWCALSVIHKWDAPQVVRDYLTTGDESLRDVARAAAWGATWDAERAATELAAAWDAARAAAERAAERDIARGAVWDAAWESERAAAERGVAWNAARGVAWSAARAAARDAQRKQFNAMVAAKFAEAE